MKTVNIKNLDEYKSFVKKLYADDKMYKDNKTSLIDIVCGKRSVYRKYTAQQMIAVQDEDKTLCQCILIRHRSYKDIMMAAFFESVDNTEAFIELSRYAEVAAKESGCQLLVFGLDGHCNYSAGFLTEGFNSPPCFGQSYNPEYYSRFFADNGYQPIGFVSFTDKLKNLDMATAQYYSIRFGKSVELNYADFGRGYKNTMHRYTDLNNTIFSNHRYYFHREYDEDIDLFSSMRPLLKNENLIFATENGKDEGFVLWYPDFNSLVNIGRGASIDTFLKYRLQNNKPSAVKIVEIGVMPEYEGSGLILKLLSQVFSIVKEKYPYTEDVISSWILEENNRSKRLSSHLLKNFYKRFTTYEKKI